MPFPRKTSGVACNVSPWRRLERSSGPFRWSGITLSVAPGAGNSAIVGPQPDNMEYEFRAAYKFGTSWREMTPQILGELPDHLIVGYEDSLDSGPGEPDFDDVVAHYRLLAPGSTSWLRFLDEQAKEEEKKHPK